MTDTVTDLKERLTATWTAGDYEAFARYLEAEAVVFYRRLHVPPGTALLDVACGAGQVTLIAARDGARATGCDIAANWLERARARARVEGLEVGFDEADAERLPYPDDAFDIVVSLYGAIFAPRPDLVAAELARVCRPGGRIAMGNWTPEGFTGQMFAIIAQHIAPPGMPSPLQWGVPDVVRERLGDRVGEVEMTRRGHVFEFPFPPEGVVDHFRRTYGPTARAFAALDDDGAQRLREALVTLWSHANRGGPGTTVVDSEYLEVIAGVR